jgi:D-alanyl-D-alanine dipeptidase
MLSRRAIRLVPASRFPFVPQYAHQALPGADRVCRVAEPVLEQLLQAQQHLRAASTSARRFDLLIWDAYRAHDTQRWLFDDYTDRLMREEGLEHQAAAEAATRYVSHPASVYPHGTGGAVDLTLLVDDEEAVMGTSFDAFEENAAADWYDRHPPRTPMDRHASANRERLCDAMRSGGFVPHPDEWWHYEWGTMRWAAETGYGVVLDRTVEADG